MNAYYQSMAAKVLICLAVVLNPLTAQAGSMRGFADIHIHQFANHALGGFIVVGSPYGSIQDELSESKCRFAHSDQHKWDFFGGWLAGHIPFPR